MKVIGYYPAWEPQKFDRINFDVVTNIIYSFAIPTREGGLLPLDHSDDAKKLIALAHSKNVKIHIALGGWSWEDIPLEPTFVEATNSADKREKLVRELIAMVESYGFDGVDMDWEHPRVNDGTYKQYEALVLLLSDELHKHGKLLTCAVIGGVDANGNPGGIDTGGADVGNAVEAQTDAVLNAVDWINVMGYDGPGDHHSSFEYAKGCISYWKNIRNMPAQKIAIGVPFYGKGTAYAGYDKLFEENSNAHLTDMCEFNGGICKYNGVATIKAKAKLALEQGLGGIMIWELSQDCLEPEKSLQVAIGEALEEL